jgi:hypothetical protein
MLKVSSDSRQAALDMRLVTHPRPGGLQLVFSGLGTPREG